MGGGGEGGGYGGPIGVAKKKTRIETEGNIAIPANERIITRRGLILIKEVKDIPGVGKGGRGGKKEEAGAAKATRVEKKMNAGKDCHSIGHKPVKNCSCVKNVNLGSTDGVGKRPSYVLTEFEKNQ